MTRIARLILAISMFAPLIQAAPQADAPVGLRMIAVRTESEAARILERLRAGEGFEQLARSQSLDPSSRSGGYLGVLAVSDLRPEFQSALDGLRPGQVSPVARLGNGYVVLQLLTGEETRAIELRAWTDEGKDPRSPIVERLWTMAIASNDPAAIKNVLDSGADVNFAFGDGSTVLMGAAQAGPVESVRVLLAAGASVSARTQDGTTALLAAAQAGRTEIVRLLLGAGADVNARKKNGVTPLIDAAFGGHLETVRALLDAGANPNLTLEDGSTALMAASVNGRNDVIRALLAAGAPVNGGMSTGGTALMEAAYAGQAETVRLLLGAGADPKAADPNGLTALMGAALKGSADTVGALLDAGADASARDAKGWTALTYARASSIPAIVRMVLAKTTNITPEERSLALGGTFINEYYSSGDNALLDAAGAEFQKIIGPQAQHPAALEWMGAVEYLRWGDSPSLEQFRKAHAYLKKSVDLDPKDPDRHYWIAAISSIFASAGKGAPAAETAAIVEEGIAHAKRAIELDPQFADAMHHLSMLYRRKSERASASQEQSALAKMAEAAQQDAVRTRTRLGNRPSRFNDQFSRPALPPPPL